MGEVILGRGVLNRQGGIVWTGIGGGSSAVATP